MKNTAENIRNAVKTAPSDKMVDPVCVSSAGHVSSSAKVVRG